MLALELLSPARDAETGIEAIRHGADAVYIGGPSFGARASAGNTVEDISRLCHFAHLYGARVYVTVNTIIYDNELEAARTLIYQLYDAGVDALITQDVGLLALDLPPIPLHASTQMDNCTAEQVSWLEHQGYQQVVLARELSLDQIREIRQATTVPLEAFVHGALCVSYSGRCYASELCFGRSANRGACAQFCRLSFDLKDADGKVILKDKHLLSLRDMNRSASLKEMVEAGVQSFKIEGRLKDTGYVKNITAYYRQRLDEIIAAQPDCYCRSSFGTSEYTFEPNPNKSFNRGFTEYFLHGRQDFRKASVFQPHTPKALGEAVGHVDSVQRTTITVRGCNTAFNAGDGICFFGTDDKLYGFRVNRAEGNRLYPALPITSLPTAGTPLYRNNDAAFEHLLNRPSATRRIAVDIVFRDTPNGFCLEITDEALRHVSLDFEYEHQVAQRSQHDNIVKQLSRLGDTEFVTRKVDVVLSSPLFIPSSILSDWRRQIVEALRIIPFEDKLQTQTSHETHDTDVHPDFVRNVANRAAKSYLQKAGIRPITAYECDKRADKDTPLMTCRHCILHAYGQCRKSGHTTWALPLSISLADGRSFRLKFDCPDCQMLVLKPQ